MSVFNNGLVFPDRTMENFDFNEGWAVDGVDTNKLLIKYKGVRKNKGLEIVIGYEKEPQAFVSKINGYLSDKKVIETSRKNAVQAGTLSEEELNHPIDVLEFFPPEIFLVDATEPTNFENF